MAALTEAGRRLWKIENEGFNEQKKIGYMISQVMEAWERLWKKAALSLSEKHSRVFESFQSVKLSEHRHETGKRFQIRFQ